MNNRRLKIPLLFPVCGMVLFSMLFLLSCDDEWPYEVCDCHKGNNSIDDWENADDSTIVSKKDSVGLFEISLDDWDGICSQDIRL